MNTSTHGRARRRGVTYMEVLVASLIMTLSLAGIIQTWCFAYTMSSDTDLKGVAYSIGRRRIEAAKETGFYNTPLSPATTVYYYDGNGNNESTTKTASSVFAATVNVSCDLTTTNSQGVTVPADTGLTTVTVTVSLVSNSQPLYSTTTNLARAGI